MEPDILNQPNIQLDFLTFKHMNKKSVLFVTAINVSKKKNWLTLIIIYKATSNSQFSFKPASLASKLQKWENNSFMLREFIDGPRS